MRTRLLIGSACLCTVVLAPLEASARDGGGEMEFGAPVSEDDLARTTGKFTLSNGEELALTITSDTLVNGQAVLRTVLTVDHGESLQVFGRDPSEQASSHAEASTNPTAAPAVTIVFDRQSGTQAISPAVSVGAMPTVLVNAPIEGAKEQGLVALSVATGGPAIATPDGLVSVAAVRGGAQVTLSGDQYAVANLVGPAIASAIVNSGNNRTFDTVTNVSIDLQNAAPYQLASGVLRANTLALDATRAMIR